MAWKESLSEEILAEFCEAGQAYSNARQESELEWAEQEAERRRERARERVTDTKRTCPTCGLVFFCDDPGPGRPQEYCGRRCAVAAAVKAWRVRCAASQITVVNHTPTPSNTST